MEQMGDKRARRRRQSVHLIGAATALGVIAGLVLALSSFGDGDRAARTPAPSASVAQRASTSGAQPAAVGVGESASVPVSVGFDLHHPGSPVPRRFLGLSFEVSSLRQIAAYAAGGDLVRLLRSLGPGLLRFGGVSADTRVAWSDPLTPRPPWASSVIDAGDLRRLGRLATRSGWQVLLTVALAHFDPAAAAREAAAAKAALGHNLAGIELGNEPDAYAKHGFRTQPWTFTQYNAQVSAYRRAIGRAAPGIPLVGPDVSGSAVFRSWGRGEAVRDRPALLTGHHYPLGCHDVPAPTIARLLSPRVRRLEGMSVRRYTSISRARAIGFRLDEANTVSCGGRSGISDTFASALWAVDYVTRTMAAGMAGINFQAAPANCAGYSALCAATPAGLAKGALRAQPEWYALLLTRALVGSRPVRSAFRAPRGRNLDVSSFLTGDGGLMSVIVDDDPPAAGPIAISLRVARRFAGASIVALTAPAPAARSGVTLGSRAVAADGSWSEPTALSQRPNRSGTITLVVAPSSAVLATVAPAHGARPTR
jgi:hypothetical protein